MEKILIFFLSQHWWEKKESNNLVKDARGHRSIHSYAGWQNI